MSLLFIYKYIFMFMSGGIKLQRPSYTMPVMRGSQAKYRYLIAGSIEHGNSYRVCQPAYMQNIYLVVEMAVKAQFNILTHSYCERQVCSKVLVPSKSTNKTETTERLMDSRRLVLGGSDLIFTYKDARGCTRSSGRTERQTWLYRLGYWC
ncbi:uncharacterized protein LOC111070860 [Drosophila obscura]|uniref:uncharacterized protein LOC111070860 n=1 Tax=Drosophila obscura TaxID=7282 RepID=UPI001BB1020D|nr:uncharacterized protein LOC111070860 [Drosophila obscura]